MMLRVRLFAVARQLAGRDELLVEVPSGATVAELRRAIEATCPPLAAILPHARIAVDEEFADEGSLVAAETEVAVIPPLSGG